MIIRLSNITKHYQVGPEKIRVFYVQFIKDRGVTASLNH